MSAQCHRQMRSDLPSLIILNGRWVTDIRSGGPPALMPQPVAASNSCACSARSDVKVRLLCVVVSVVYSLCCSRSCCTICPSHLCVVAGCKNNSSRFAYQPPVPTGRPVPADVASDNSSSRNAGFGIPGGSRNCQRQQASTSAQCHQQQASASRARGKWMWLCVS